MGITKIAEHLYLGSCGDSGHLQFANPLGITAVVNVSQDADDPIDGVVNFHEPVPDGTISPGSFDAVLNAIAGHIQSGKVLVHCLMGTSRSPVMVATYLAVSEGISIDAALKRIQKLRSQVDPTPETLASAKRYLADRRLREDSAQGATT